MRIFSFLFLVCLTCAGASANSQCPQIDCQCEAIPGDQWQQLCAAREVAIQQECSAAGGEPQSFCRLHGPAGTPLALSVTAEDTRAIEPVRSEAAVSDAKALIATREWSIRDDLKTLDSSIKKGNFAEASQVARILERNLEQLFELQSALLAGALKLQSGNAGKELAISLMEKNRQLALQLDTTSQDLWERWRFSLPESTAKAAYKTLAQRVGRMAGTQFEYSATMAAASRYDKDSALSWQSAAELSERLAKWEQASTQRAAHMEFYREQASARWHRATWHWLNQNLHEQALASNLSAQQALMALSEKSVAEAEEDAQRAADQDQVSAIE